MTQSNDEQRRLWAQEYVSIGEKLSTGTTRVWYAMSLFVGGAVAAAALMLVVADESFFGFIGTYVVGVGITIMLWLFVNWFARGERWVRKVLNERQDELEKELGFYAGRYFRQLDHKNKPEKRRWDDDFYRLFPSGRKHTLESLYKDYPVPSRTKRGWAFIDWAIRITMLLWAAVILVAFARWLLSIQPFGWSQIWHTQPSEFVTASVLLGVPALVIAVRALVVAACAVWRTRTAAPRVAARRIRDAASALLRVGPPSCSIDRETKDNEQEQ